MVGVRIPTFAGLVQRRATADEISAHLRKLEIDEMGMVNGLEPRRGSRVFAGPVHSKSPELGDSSQADEDR